MDREAVRRRGVVEIRRDGVVWRQTYRSGEPDSEFEEIGTTDKTGTRVTFLPDRSIFAGKRYLPIRLVESARGCPLRCDFCAVQSFFGATQSHHPADRVGEEVRRISRPGLRNYVGSAEIPRVRAGLGVAVVSTSEGVMSGNDARRKNLGGEVVCYVW